MDKRLTRLEKQWILYDVGNSAFILLVSTIMPIYFNSLAERGGLSSVQYLAYWGYASSIATLLVALSGPVFGTFSDIKGLKKPLFATAMLIGVLGCAALGFTRQWLWFLIVFVIARFGYAVSLIFYDSMLTDITQPDRMDRVSSHGFAWGYIGSCIPFVWSLGVVLSSEHLGISMETAMAFAFLLTAAWWFCMTLPLLRHFQQRYYIKRQPHAIRMSFSRLWHTLRGMRRQKQVFFFLLAFFFYIDGVYTIIDMATAYGEALGLDSTGLLLALLVLLTLRASAPPHCGALTKADYIDNINYIAELTDYGMRMDESGQWGYNDYGAYDVYVDGELVTRFGTQAIPEILVDENGVVTGIEISFSARAEGSMVNLPLQTAMAYYALAAYDTDPLGIGYAVRAGKFDADDLDLSQSGDLTYGPISIAWDVNCRGFEVWEDSWLAADGSTEDPSYACTVTLTLTE